MNRKGLFAIIFCCLLVLVFAWPVDAGRNHKNDSVTTPDYSKLYNETPPYIDPIHTGSYQVPDCLSGEEPIFLNYCKSQMDILYNQSYWATDTPATGQRSSYEIQKLTEDFGEAERIFYGDPGDEYASYEYLYLLRTPKVDKAPVIVFIHGGAWQSGSGATSISSARMFLEAGVSYIALNFVNVPQTNPPGNLMEMAIEVRKAFGWIYKNAKLLGVDPNQIYAAGHSSGGHLCGVIMTTDWSRFDLPMDMVKGGLCVSGMYDLDPVSLSYRNTYVNFTPEVIEELSAVKNMQYLNAPMYVVHGTRDTPEFQRQSRDFVLAAEAAGKDVNYRIGRGYNHSEISETMGNPYGPVGRAALDMLGLKMTIAEREDATFKPDKWTNSKSNNKASSKSNHGNDNGKNSQAGAGASIGAKILSGLVSLITALFSW